MTQYNRPADFVERAYILRTLRANYKNFNMSIKLAHHVDKVVLSNALRAVVRKHIVTTYSFFTDGKRPFKETLGRDYELRTPEYIRFNDVVTFEKIDKLDGDFLASLNQILIPHNIPNHPTWRVKVLETSDGDQWISVLFDHAFVDGTSGKKFVTDLSRECSKVTSTEFIEEIFNRERDADVIPDVPIESSESCKLFNITWTQRMLFTIMFSAQKVIECLGYIRSFFPYNKIEANTSVYPPFRYDLKDREIGIKILAFDPEELKQILKKCRSQNVTLTTYLQTLALRAIENQIFKAVSPKPHSSSIIIPVNGRKFLPPTPDHVIANYSVFTALKMSPVTGNEWNVMRYINKHFDQQATEKYKMSFLVFAMMRYINVMDFLDMFEDGEVSTSVLSNVGRVDNTEGKYEIVDCIFSQSGAANYFGLNVVSTAVGGLRVTLSWQDDFEKVHLGDRKISDLLAEQIRQDILSFPVEK